MRGVRVIVGVVAGIVLVAGALAAGVGIQYHHDRPVYAARAAALADARRAASERDTAYRNASDSGALAAQTRVDLARVKDELAQVKAQQSDTDRADAEGYIRGLCAGATLAGTPVATLSEAVRSIDETLWAACQAGIDLATQTMATQGSVPQVAAAPAVPMPAYSGIICADGWVSHAAHRQGACSWHGGISP